MADETPTLADDIVWAFLRIVFGPWPVMWMAGAVHHDVWNKVPPWSWTQSTTIAISLTMVAWFFRR